MAFMTFHILGIIIPTDALIFFRGVGIPPTSVIWVCLKIVYTPNMATLTGKYIDTPSTFWVHHFKTCPYI